MNECWYNIYYHVTIRPCSTVYTYSCTEQRRATVVTSAGNHFEIALPYVVLYSLIKQIYEF
jgi:hypothetical protein